MDYAKDRSGVSDNRHGHSSGSSGSGMDRDREGGRSTSNSGSGVKADWICNKCQCQNFARRNECFKCSAPKTDDCTIVSSATINPNSEQFTDTVYDDAYIYY